MPLDIGTLTYTRKYTLFQFLDDLLINSMEHSGYGLGQWETTVHCNVVSHWLSPYPETLATRTYQTRPKASYHHVVMHSGSCMLSQILDYMDIADCCWVHVPRHLWWLCLLARIWSSRVSISFVPKYKWAILQSISQQHNVVWLPNIMGTQDRARSQFERRILKVPDHESCHDDNFVVTSGIGSCHYDKFRPRQWRQSCRYDNLMVSMDVPSIHARSLWPYLRKVICSIKWQKYRYVYETGVNIVNCW